MKIIIRTEGKSFTVPLPMALLSVALKKLAPESGSKADGGDAEEVEALGKALCRELKRARRDFGHMELLHIHSCNGDEVIIML